VLIYIGIRDISDFNMIELITTSMFVLSSIYGGPTTVDAATVSTTTAPGASSRIEERMTSKELEQTAKVYFKNVPILVDIARCESSFRQVDENGNILRGKVNKGDVGIMQINEYYHADKAKELGLDLKTVSGNLAYAKYLYDKEGTQPWISSSKCWNHTGDQVALK
jgi:soluble lytic murein transglycosylase-like protein